MLKLEEIRQRLQDRRAAFVAECTGLRVGTVIDIRAGRVANPAYDTVKRLSDYLESDDL